MQRVMARTRLTRPKALKSQGHAKERSSRPRPNLSRLLFGEIWAQFQAQPQGLTNGKGDRR